MDKYYVVTFLVEDMNNGAFCIVCGVYNDLKGAKLKMEDVFMQEEKYLNDNDICYEREFYETKMELYATTGDWSYTIEIQIVDKN